MLPLTSVLTDDLYIYICCFITKILFSYTGDQLETYCASDIFYSSQAAYNCYLLPNCVTEQSRRYASGMRSPLACIADNIEQNYFYIHKMAIWINELILHHPLNIGPQNTSLMLI